MVYKKTSANELPIEISKLGPYVHFGALSLVFNEPYAGTVKAIGPLKCLKMDYDTFQTELRPMLLVFQRSAQQYKTFMNFPV
jgi:CRP-like cAMP-binding protein